MRSDRVTAVILGAGLGRRLGYPKAALRLADRWVLPDLVRNLRLGGASRVVLVLSPPALDAIADLGHPGADLEVSNPDPDAGRSVSLQLGLAAADAGAALLVHPCDVPMLCASTVHHLIHSWRCSHPAALLARPVTAGGRGGHPLLIAPELRDEVAALGADEPLRALLQRHPERLLNVVCADDPGPFLNVNTLDQLRLVESLLAP